ncbi:hypothetical protein [Patulibacter minatonensis]|uniref:hypothetical protein n=1 Tax=Patulibacter minatonensis TaxID=298163 RepID=UPI000479D29B|nr:hypothetical protein [Patulibacter minatonensis]
MPEPHRQLEDVTVDDLVACLQSAGVPLGARRLRTALRLDPWCLPAQLTRFLGEAVDTGRVVRTGTGPATRYAVAEDQQQEDDACVGAGGAGRRRA